MRLKEIESRKKEKKSNLLSSLQRFSYLFIMLFLLSFFSQGIIYAQSDPLDTWNWRNPLPQGNPLRDIVYDNSMFVAVGAAGTILTSPDGISWTSRTSGISDSLSGIAYGNSIFVAVGTSQKILTSSDGITWTTRMPGVSGAFTGITYGNSTFTAVGTAGRIATSPDGISWTSRTSGTVQSFWGITYDNSMFIAVGDAGTILTSPDGISWTSQTSGAVNTLNGITYGNSTFTAVGNGGTIVTSPDGISWTSRISGTVQSFYGITYDNSKFIAVGKGGTIYTSPDGITWTSRTSGTTKYLNRITYGNSISVAVGDVGIMLTSSDGIAWTSRSSGTTESFEGITYGNSTFIAVGTAGGLETSSDGITWTSRTSGTSHSLSGITYGNSIFVAVGSVGTILTSPDGIIWTSRTSVTSHSLFGITYGNSIFVAVGSGGTILTSPDGIIWTSRTSGTSNYLRGITYDNSIFVAVGDVGTILTSPDGITWTSRTSGTNQELFGITYGNYMFIAVGFDGTILTSSNGIIWTSRTSGTNQEFFGITYGNSIFVAVGSVGTILTSPDGIIWTSRTSVTDNTLFEITYDNSTFISVGTFGAILQSDSFSIISGNAGVAGAILSYTDGSIKTVTADGSGNYSFTVSYNWSGIVTPLLTGYTFTPPIRTYNNVLSNQASQDYIASSITYTISGNAGVAGATLSYTDGSAKTATADGSGNYSFTVSFNWSGTVTPSMTGYTFTPPSRTYNNVLSNQTTQNYVANLFTPTISGNAGVAGAILSYNDGGALTATADGSGNYSFTVTYDWSGTVTPSLAGYMFIPTEQRYTNVISDQVNQDYTVNAIIVLTTKAVSEISSTTANSGGNVTSGGSSPVTSRGVCWSKSVNPTIANSITSNGSGTGGFISVITGLNSNTTYHVRAYAINSSGTSYGNDRSFITGAEENELAVSTQDVSSIEKTSAIGNGNITSLGVLNPIAHGVCWSITKTPTIAGNHTNEGTAGSTGAFTSEITGLSENIVYYVRAYATDANGTVYGEEVSFTTNSSLSPIILLSRKYFNFGSDTSNTTKAQELFIYNLIGSTLNWTITDDAPWLLYSPVSGTGTAKVSVSVDTSGLSAGIYTGIINVMDPNAVNSPQSVIVTLTIKDSGDTSYPFGSFDTPIDNSTVRSSIAVTGWALDDIGVESVKIYRAPVEEEGSSLIYIGEAVFVDGIRTDIEALYPDYPLNHRAGWGYMLLTNFLPTNGNGNIKLYAKAVDIEGNETVIGVKRIICDNANAVKPFGGIDTPTQGGIASGTFVNFGWALTPQPNTIPFDGSTIKVYIDGVLLGNPVYNIYRADIATLFPGYNNSNGAVGYFNIDTTAYENGKHTIQWSAEDNAGNIDGIGSRFFTIINPSSDKKSKSSNFRMIDIKDLSNYDLNYQSVEVLKGLNDSRLTTYVSRLEIKELERIVLNINPDDPKLIYTGYLRVENQLRKLPIGSSLKDGKFYWSPGPGFIGEYDLVFVDMLRKTRKEIKIIIKPVLRLKIKE